MLTKIPHGLDEIIAMFGDPASVGWEEANIVSFDLPYPLIYDGGNGTSFHVTRTRCHRLVVENFIGAFRDIEAAALTPLVTNFGGLYNQRQKRTNPSHPSTHSWGIAIDLEPKRYPLGGHDRFPDAVVTIFQKYGFMYGGDFHGTLDPMHWQLATGY